MILTMTAALASCGGDGAPEAATPPDRPTPEASTAAPAEPDHSGNALELRVDPDPVSPGEIPSAVLVNGRDVVVGFSDAYKLEEDTGDAWRWMNEGQAFRRSLYVLAPGESGKPLRLAVDPAGDPLRLSPGRYRLTIEVLVEPDEPSPPSVEVSTTFRVDGP